LAVTDILQAAKNFRGRFLNCQVTESPCAPVPNINDRRDVVDVGLPLLGHSDPAIMEDESVLSLFALSNLVKLVRHATICTGVAADPDIGTDVPIITAESEVNNMPINDEPMEGDGSLSPGRGAVLEQSRIVGDSDV
jgi:hypothetical protein